MDNIFKPYHTFCLVYVDDIIVFSKTKKENKHHLAKIAKEIRDNGIMISEKKMELEIERINFLGVIINKGAIELQNHILEKIDLFPSHLKDKLQVQRFLGCT